MRSARPRSRRAGAIAGSGQAALTARLTARRREIEQTILTRVKVIADPAEVGDPAYLEGFHAALSAALDFGLEALERDAERAPSIPPTLLAQARVAARAGVGLDTVLRRYFAGCTVLVGFAIEESATEEAALRPMLRTLSVLFDRLVAALGEEYARETAARAEPGAAQRRSERVRRLLAGEQLDATELLYDFEATHVGLLAVGPGAAEALAALAASLDCRPLSVPGGDDSLWAWLGARRPLDPDELKRRLAVTPPDLHLALGEPGFGLGGWRLTHRQAAAALPVALRGPERIVRYADVALLASVLQDDLLARSLRRMYIEPFESDPDGGEATRRILRAYFASDRNASSTAVALGVSRNTVASRLRAIEVRLGRSLDGCGAELEAALGLDRLQAPSRVAR